MKLDSQLVLCLKGARAKKTRPLHTKLAALLLFTSALRSVNVSRFLDAQNAAFIVGAPGLAERVFSSYTKHKRSFRTEETDTSQLTKLSFDFSGDPILASDAIVLSLPLDFNPRVQVSWNTTSAGLESCGCREWLGNWWSHCPGNRSVTAGLKARGSESPHSGQYPVSGRSPEVSRSD